MLGYWQSRQVAPALERFSMACLDVPVPPIECVFFDNETQLRHNLICRICHYQDTIDRLIAPCRCTNRNKFIHQQCFVSWVISQTQSRRISRHQLTSLRCELCSQVFKVKVQFNHKFSCKVFKRNIMMKGFRPVVVFIIIFTISFSLVTYIVVANRVNDVDQKLEVGSTLGNVLLLVADLILFCILGILLVVFFHQNLLYMQILIEKVYNHFELADSTRTSVQDEDLYPTQYFVVERREQPVT